MIAVAPGVQAGLELRAVSEPVPGPAAIVARPELDRHHRQPSILVLAAVKPEGQSPG